MRPLPLLWLLLAPPAGAAEDPLMEFARGVLAESRGDAVAAAAFHENALRLDPTAVPLVRLAVERRLAAGDRSSAIRLFRDLAAARPDAVDVQLSYADLLTREGAGDALALKLATTTLESVLVKHPGDPEVIRRLFSIHHNSGNRDRAMELPALLDEREPEAVMLFAKLTGTLHDADDAAARTGIGRRYLAALEAHPEHAPLARAAADHFLKGGDRDQAITILQRHAGAAPWSLELRARLGILLFSAKRNDEGQRVFHDLLAIHPRHAAAHQALAKFHRLQGDSTRAAVHAGELLKIRGGDAGDFLKLADEHLAAERPREARLLLEKAVFDHPDHLLLRMRLATATLQDPETRGRAARLFREAEAVAPDGKITDPEFLATSAEVLIESGQSKAAEERLRAAIRAWPPAEKKKTAATLRRLASLWEAENRNAEAARALRQRADSLAPP